MKKHLVRVLIAGVPLALILVLVTLIFVGPWPVYREMPFEESRYYERSLRAIDESLARSAATRAPARLQAGWAVRDMTPPIGTPLAGYAGRPNEKQSTGVHDPIFAKAAVLHDGEDTVAIVALDLLMTTQNLVDRVLVGVAEKTPLTLDSIFFTSTHTHCATGGYMPGLVGSYSAGDYDPALEILIADAMTEAILAAHGDLAPASLAHGTVAAPEFIINRTGMSETDHALDFLVLKKDTGETCHIARYSAHATILPDTFLEVSAEYPGVFCRVLEEKAETTALFLGGAVGAMGPRPLDGATPLEVMEETGAGLAAKILSYDQPLDFETAIDIRSLSAPVYMPAMQARLGMENWRLSPYFAKVLGVPTIGHIQALQLNDLVLLGTSHDTGGEIAVEWVAAATEKHDLRLWVTSHAIAYCGYLVPDEYYWREAQGYDQNYEWRLMNWYGPRQGAYYTALQAHILEALAE